MKKLCLYALGIMSLNGHLITTPLGFLEPYNFMIESEPLAGKQKWQWNFISQTAFDTQSFNQDGTVVNALQIYEPEQNMFGLFQGADSQTQLNQLANSIAGGPGGGVMNLENGLLRPSGKFSGSQVAFLSSYAFAHNCYFKVSLPAYKIKLSDVEWTYTGNNTTFSGQLIEDELVSIFLQDAQTLYGLNLGSWTTAGLGDLALLLDYIADFPQGRTVLRNVRVHARAGLTFPTGTIADENQLMSQPLGADGSVTLPFGGGLDINLGRYFQCGFRAQFNYIWGNVKDRRVPTFPSQTTLLYPTIMSTYKNHGITQLFDLYGQIYNAWGGMSLKLAYEYFFKSQDTISINQSGYSYNQLQTALTLDEITAHKMIILVSFDSLFLKKHDKIHPQVGLFLNLPFNGSLTTLASTVGVQLSLDW